MRAEESTGKSVDVSASLRAMKLALIFALLLPLSAFGRETAYQALRTVGAERSQGFLKSVIEVKGRNGVPQPTVWTILINDPLARGGVREIEVSNGHITSERTPLKAYSGQGEGSALNFEKLNLDSEGAFAVAEAEARNLKIGFFGVDYVLRCDETGGAPLWIVQLLDDKQHSVGSVTVAADTGTVVSKTFASAPPSKGSWKAGGGLKGRLVRFKDSVGRTVKHTSGDVEEFLTGDRTLDPPSR